MKYLRKVQTDAEIIDPQLEFPSIYYYEEGGVIKIFMGSSEGKVLCYIDDVPTELDADKTFHEQGFEVVYSDFEPGIYYAELEENYRVEGEKPVAGKYYYVDVKLYDVDEMAGDPKCYKPNITFNEQGFDSIYYLMYDEEYVSATWTSCLDLTPKELSETELASTVGLSTKVVSAKIAYKDEEEQVKRTDVILSPYYDWGTQCVVSEHIGSTMYACSNYAEPSENPINNDGELYFSDAYYITIYIDERTKDVGSVVTFYELGFGEMYDKNGETCVHKYPEEGGTYKTTQG